MMNVSRNWPRGINGFRVGVAVGARVPGARVPGAKVPGAKVPGAKVPGAKVLGAKVLAARGTGANFQPASREQDLRQPADQPAIAVARHGRSRGDDHGDRVIDPHEDRDQRRQPAL